MAVTLDAEALLDEWTQVDASVRLPDSGDGTMRARAVRVATVAQTVVERYAPAAPDELQDEAFLRFGCYLLQSSITVWRGGAANDLDDFEPASVNYSRAWRESGAAMLLSEHRTRRAGAIGEL